MEPVSHQKIQALLQAAADQALAPQDRALVDAHLAGCRACSDYAQNLDELQDGLRRVTRQQWDLPSHPLSIRLIKERAQKAVFQNKVDITIGRFAVVPVLALALIMAVRMMGPGQIQQTAISNMSTTPQLPSRTPMPSSYTTTATKLTEPGDCREFIYIVQGNDTLAGIAARYGVSKETLVAYNGLESGEVPVGSRLVIPICQPTATRTTTTPTLTITTAPSP